MSDHGHSDEYGSPLPSPRLLRPNRGLLLPELLESIHSEAKYLKARRSQCQRHNTTQNINADPIDIDNSTRHRATASPIPLTSTTTTTDHVTPGSSIGQNQTQFNDSIPATTNHIDSTNSPNVSISGRKRRTSQSNSGASTDQRATTTQANTAETCPPEAPRRRMSRVVSSASQVTRRFIRSALETSKQIGKPTSEILKEYELNAQSARLFCYDQTAFDIHGDHFNGYNCGDPYSGGISGLKRLDPVSKETIRSCAQEYLQQMRPDLPISRCASCGVQKINGEFKLVPLSGLELLHLNLETARAQRYLSISDPDVKKCFTIFKPKEDEEVYYDLHEALLQKDSYGNLEAPLCFHCARDILQREERPEFNVGNKYDFGQYPAGLQLSLAEKVVVGKCIGFQTCIKFVDTDQEHIKGHCIYLPHDGNNVLAQTLPCKIFDRLPLKVAFVGKKSLWKKLTGSEADRKKFIENNAEFLMIRPDVVFQWLKLKKMLDAKSTYEIDESEEAISALSEMPELLLLSADVIDGIESLRAEKATSDNIAAPKPPSTEMANQEPTTEAILDSVYIGPVVQPEAISDIDVMKALGEQLNQVRTQLNQSIDLQSTDDIEDPDEVLDFVVPNPVNDSNEEATEQSHPADTQTTTAPVSSDQETIQIPVRTSAINEIVDNESLYLGAFGHLFLLGEGAPKKMTLSQAQINHMLDQYDGRFANSAQILFTMLNQLQRGITLRQVSLRVRGNHILMKKFAKIVNDKQFADKLQYAIENPTADECKQLVNIINELITISGSNIPYSQMERNSAYPRILAMKRHFGAFSFFVTISPADMDSILTMRLSNLEDIDCNEMNIPIKLPDSFRRLKLLSRNSMAAATIYQKTMELFFSHLIGLDPTHVTRKSPPAMDERKEGALGVAIAFASVTEFQSRGSPHSHFLLFTDISPLTIQRHLDEPGFMERFGARLDSMIKCQLPEDISAIKNATSELPVEEQTPIYRDHRVTVPCESYSALMDFGDIVACGCNVHTHSATCHKGHSGDRSCRMAMPRACFNGPTCCLQLELINKDSDGMAQVRALKEIEPRNTQYDNEPLMRRYDDRYIVVEPSRPGPSSDIANDIQDTNERYRNECPQGSNENIVAFSPTITACLRCNTNVEILGNASQEKCSTFYTIKYMTKSAYKTDAILSIVSGANRHVEQYPSIADDSGEYMRNAQHILSRVLNVQNGCAEISLQAAVLALRGFPSNVFSHEFFYCFIRPAIVFVRRLRRAASSSDNNSSTETQEDSNTITSDSNSISNSDSNSDTNQFESHQPRDLFVDRDFDELPVTENDEDFEFDEAMQIHTDSEGKVRIVAQHEHYMYRGEDLKDYSFYEYSSIICITKKSKKKKKNDESVGQSTETSQPEAANASGRLSNATYEFSTDHPLHLTHVQQLRSKQRIPILAGRAHPPHPGPRNNSRKWKEAAKNFAEYVIILHHPWNLQTYRPDVELSYEGLTEWIHTMEQSPYFEDKCRLFWMENLAQGMKIDTDTLKVMTAWRARYARVWNATDNMIHLSSERVVEKTHHLGLSSELEMEADLHRRLLDPDGERSKSAEQAEALAEHLYQLTTEANAPVISEIRMPAILNEGKKGAFKNIFDQISKRKESEIDEVDEEEEEEEDRESNRDLSNSDDEPVDENLEDDDISAEMNSNLDLTSRQIESDNELAPQDTIDRALQIHTIGRSVRNRVPETPISQLNEKQNDVLIRISRWYNDTYTVLDQDPGSEGIKLLLSGAAGTGKSFLVRKIVERLGAEQIRCVSFQGVAASLLPGGNTVHKTFGISTGAEYSTNSKTCRLARRNFGSAVLLVIDEISNTSDKLLQSIDNRLRSWFNKTKPFGGIGVLAMGDMFQMPPVLAKSLVHAAFDMRNVTGMLFNSFELVTLTKPMRSDEPAFLKLLDCYRNPELSMTPVQKSQTFAKIKRLTKDDFQADSKWTEATIVVSENVTRITLNKSQSFAYGKTHNQPVISWRNSLTPTTANAFKNFAHQQVQGDTSKVSEYIDRTAESLPDMKFYFVKGAPASLKDNIWTSAGLCNGSMCTLHSITLAGSSAERDRRRIEETGAGEEIVLTCPPMSVNVEFDQEHTILQEYSIVPGRIVIPLMLRPQSKREFYNAKQVKGHSMRDRTFEKLSYYDFGVDLAFAVTYHKVQGRTLDRVIIDMNSARSLTVAAIYVSLSRTRKQEHIRFLDLTDGKVAQEIINQKTFDSVLVKWLAKKTGNSKLMEMIENWDLQMGKGRRRTKVSVEEDFEHYDAEQTIHQQNSKKAGDIRDVESGHPGSTFKAKRRKTAQ